VHRYRRSSLIHVQHTGGSRDGLSARWRREVGCLDRKGLFGVLELVPLGILGLQFIVENGNGSSTIRTTDVYVL